ncbi:MAG TPA: cytochrome c oxidase assembly protein [Mycobacteriales bacterium]|nr:cytochrome c oxidase assembly protein [Mycobacteriales bacterium]
MALPSLATALADAGSLPPFTPARFFTESRVDPFLATCLLLAGAAYLAGVRRLRLRGDTWSRGRTASFVGGGLGTVAVATMTGLGTYDDTLFSVHMVQHMVLSMVSPVFLALGAPVTLALRTLSPARRRALVAVLHSGVARVLTFPLVGWLAFVANPFVLYFSPLYEASLRNDVLHEALHLHLLLVGCLFLWPLVGLDPVPGRVAYPLRFLLLFLALPFHAILGLSIMSGHEVIAGDYYAGLHLAWSDPASEQRVGGGLLWASGDLVGLLMLGSVAFQWMRASEREAEREDRRLDRLEAQAARQAAVAEPTAEPAAETDRNPPDT